MGARRPFDPATGDWLPAPSGAGEAGGARWDPEAPRRGPAATAWHAVLAIDLAVFGAILVADAVAPARTEGVSAAGIAYAAGLLLALAGVVPFLWAVATRQGGLHGAIHYLRLERPWPALGWGVLAGLGSLLAVFALALGLYAAGYRAENPVVREIAGVLSVPLALFVAACAAVGEEILFRGILQRWVGVWGQAALFGLAHASYGTPLQVAVPFALGLLFGLLVRRGARLWLPMAAHFTFDLVQFLLAMAADAAGAFG